MTGSREGLLVWNYTVTVRDLGCIKSVLLNLLWVCVGFQSIDPI